MGSGKLKQNQFLPALFRTIYVSKAGSDTDGTGSPASPFSTPTKAVEVAKNMTPNPSFSNPVAIIIGPGEYDGEVVIAYHGIHLYGYGQWVTKFIRNGRCLLVEDNGVDPEPWDMKVIGISFESTDPTKYAVEMNGIAGTSLGGNEIQFKDGAIAGTKCLRSNVVNYLDFQNFYIMGEVYLQQTAGAWVEQSQWNGTINVDFDPLGVLASDSGNYGVNWENSLQLGAVNLINSGKEGDMYKVNNPPYSAIAPNWIAPAPETIKDALDRISTALSGLLGAPIP